MGCPSADLVVATGRRPCDGRRREPPATPDYAAKLRAQVDELQKSLASLLDVAKRGGGGIGGGRGGDDDVGARGSGVPDLPSLPEEIKDDAEIKKLYAQHLREMLKLQLNIGRESRVVELERLRTEMVQLKDGIVPPKGGAAQQQQPYPPYPPPLRVLSARAPALRTEPRRASVPAAATATAVPEPSLRRVSGRGPRGRFGTRGRAAAEGMTPDPRPFTRLSPPPRATRRRASPENAPSAGRQSRRSKTSGPNGVALRPAERPDRAGEDGPAPRGGRRQRIRGERQRVRVSDSSQRRRLVLQRRPARALATGSWRDVPRVTVRVMMEGAGPMDLKDSPSHSWRALRGPRTLARRLRRAVRARAAHGTIRFDRAGAARYKRRAVSFAESR